MPDIYFKSVPFSKEDVTLALESGVDGIITEAEHVEGVRSLALCDVRAEADMPSVGLGSKAEEESIASRIAGGERLVLAQGWEIIPVENLLAQPAVAGKLAVEVASLAEARLAAGVLECGVPVVVVLPEALASLKNIVSELKLSQGTLTLDKATITEVKTVGLGHRVCVDTLTLMERGQGMLVGNSSAFTFLTHAETEHNEYVAARPFRINAGGVHAYAVMPGDKTCYVGELRSGDEVLIVDKDGRTSLATIGRIKTEVRPMLMITAQMETPEGTRIGSVFLQNAETIRLCGLTGRPSAWSRSGPATKSSAEPMWPGVISVCAFRKTSARYSHARIQRYPGRLVRSRSRETVRSASGAAPPDRRRGPRTAGPAQPPCLPEP